MKYLKTSELPVDNNLAKRVPADVAFRYHVLALAEDNEGVTVAMANPEDVAVQKKVTDFLGSPIYVVQSDRTKIDVRLAEIWTGYTYYEKYSVLVCSGKPSNIRGRQQTEGNLKKFSIYASQICDLLNARVTQIEISIESKHMREAIIKTMADGDYDLLVVNHCYQKIIDRMFFSPPECKLSASIDTSVLVVHEPCWPLKHILLVLQYDQIDDSAVNWAEHLAKLCHATVTILPITPLFPAMYDYAVNEMLSPESIDGKRFHGYIQEFKDSNISHLIHHHHRLPEQQILTEVYSRQYQLVIIGAESSNWVKRWFASSLVKSCLEAANCPILITKNILMQVNPKFRSNEELKSLRKFKAEKIKKSKSTGG